MSKAIVVCLVSGWAASLALAGPEWTETPDAGNTPGTSQTPIDVFMINDLTGIKGALTGAGPRGGTGDFQDMYRILIKDPENFSAIITPNASGNPTFDTQLWLFDEFGNGILGNDNNTIAGGMGESAFFNQATDGTMSRVIDPGIYFLAISGAGSVPLDIMGNPIFLFGTPDEVSGPDGSPLPFGSWSGPGQIGEYTIALTGVSFVPAPGAAGLFMAGGLVTARRRRRA